MTWNVARRTTALDQQAVALAERDPDVVALQEVTRRTIPLWLRAMEAMGLPHVRASLPDSDMATRLHPSDTATGLRPSDKARPRRLGVLIASRTPLQPAPRGLEMPWPETALCLSTDTPAGKVEIFTVHVPNAANGWVKPDTLRAIRNGLMQAGEGARVLCGDLNTPRRERSDGTVVSFARDSRARLRPERGPRWDEAELGVVPGLKDLGYRDAFRSLHGYGTRDASWTWRRIAGHDGGWRLDHVFVSAELRPVSCRYHHEWRDRQLSDHSALEADVERAGG